MVFPPLENGEGSQHEVSPSGIEMALKMLDKRDRLEKTVLMALKTNKNDF